MNNNNPYEAEELVSQYIEFHYGDTHFGVDNFARVCGEICWNVAQEQKQITKALDLGCAVGRTSFELAKYFNQVDGVDYSHQFIATAIELKNNGSKNYNIKTEGNLVENKKVQLDDLGYSDVTQRCSFKQGDACNLSEEYQGYDLIFAGNLIDRLQSPQQFLLNVHSRLNIGGIFILTSPYTWLEDYTKKENWLGGYQNINGDQITSLNGLKQNLSEHFEMIKEPKDIPFVIRETARKYQHTLAQMTIWKRVR